ncbi:MAG: hypothetical protein C4527_17975 [Candidatus Omnitrophota bacterium]|nr:MAG: hypothetical protein C4527_17975 [Candidatus Omnitrophota bacterium]
MKIGTFKHMRGWGRLVPVFLIIWSGFFAFAGCAKSPYTAYNRGIEWIRNGKAEQAETALLQAVKFDPANAGAWNQLGILAFERNAMDAAEIRFRNAYELDKHHSAYARNLALVYAARQEYEIADRLLHHSLQIDPSDPETSVALAKTSLLQNHPGEAREHLQRALQHHPAHAEALSLADRLEQIPRDVSLRKERSDHLIETSEPKP